MDIKKTQTRGVPVTLDLTQDASLFEPRNVDGLIPQAPSLEIPGIQAPIRKRTIQAKRPVSNEPKIAGEKEVREAIEKIRANNLEIKEKECLLELAAISEFPGNTAARNLKKKLARHLILNEKHLSTILKQYFNKKFIASEQKIRTVLSEIKQNYPGIPKSEFINKKIADAFNYEGNILVQDNLKKMIKSIGLTYSFYQKILSEFMRKNERLKIKNENIAYLRSLIHEIKSKPENANISLEEAQVLIIQLAQEKGKGRYENKMISIIGIAEYLGITDRACRECLSQFTHTKGKIKPQPIQDFPWIQQVEHTTQTANICLESLIHEIKSKPENANISLKEAQVLIIQLAQKKGKGRYENKMISITGIAKYLGITSRECRESLSQFTHTNSENELQPNQNFIWIQ